MQALLDDMNIAREKMIKFPAEDIQNLSYSVTIAFSDQVRGHTRCWSRPLEKAPDKCGEGLRNGARRSDGG